MKSDDEVFLKEYEILVDSATQVTNWRQGANNFFLAVNTALLSVEAYLISLNPHIGIIIGIFGIIISILWRQTIVYFTGLNTVKFKIIHRMEKKLPIAIFTEEWKEMQKEHKKTPTQIERWIPLIFLLAYLFVLMSYIIHA